MEITVKGSETEITDFILLLQNRKIVRDLYTQKPDIVTISPDVLQSRISTNVPSTIPSTKSDIN